MTNLKVFKALLKNTGVEIDAAVSGIDGLSFVKKKKYDMIFLDILMPNMDGIETLKYMRSQENNVDHNTPIIAMTANAYEGSKSDYLSKGFNEVITKPIEPRLLEQMIARNIPGNKGYTISWKTPVDI